MARGAVALDPARRAEEAVSSPGMVGDEDDTTVFLAQQDVNHAVKKGDVINGTYRVEEAEAGRVVLTYLPLDQRQTLTAKTE